MKRFVLVALLLFAVCGVVRAECGGASRVFGLRTTAIVSPFVVSAVPTVVVAPAAVRVNSHGCFLNRSAAQVLVVPSVVRAQVVRQRVRVIQSRRGRAVRVFVN